MLDEKEEEVEEEEEEEEANDASVEEEEAGEPTMELHSQFLWISRWKIQRVNW